MALIAAVCTCVSGVSRGQSQNETAKRLQLSEDNSLPAILDLASEQMGLRLEYDPRLLENLQVNLRLPGGIDPDEFWPLVNQMLVAKELTTVMPPGEELIRVVEISAANNLARVEPVIVSDDLPAQPAGYLSVLARVRHQPVTVLVESLELIVSDSGGEVTGIENQNLILISDIRPRVERALWVLRELDQPQSTIAIESIKARYISPTQLAASVTAAATTRNTLATDPLEGSIKPAGDASSLILIAPADELAVWHDLLEKFDRRQPVSTRTYLPAHFSLDEVATLLEQTIHEPAPAGSGEQWKVVIDTLTGSLHVTATPSEHTQIEAFLERLSEVPADARRQTRTFPIRNRGADEMVELLSSLIEAGVLQAGSFNRGLEADTSGIRLNPTLPPPPAPLERAPPEADATQPPEERLSTGDSSSEASPPLKLTADTGTNTVIAIGEPRVLDQLEALIRELDRRQPQVMIETLVINLTEGDTLDLGAELQKLEVSGDTLIQLSSLFGLGNVSAGASELPDVSGRGFTGVVLNPGDFSVVIRALKTINEGRTLTMPNILVNNNQQASLDAIREEPFTSTNASDVVATTSFGGSSTAGTQVTVKPQIAKGDHLVLEYAVTLSSFVGESADPALPPPRQQNTLQSIVTIPDGYTIVVGGLDTVNEAEAVSQVPLLGEIPFLGEIFKSRSLSQSRSRYYVFIRPTIMRHTRFEDLKYISDQHLEANELEDGWPEVQPRIIR